MAIIQRIRTVFTGVAGSPYYSNIYVTANPADATPEIAAVDQFWTALAPHIDNALSWTVEGIVANVDTATGQIVSFSSNTSQGGTGGAGGEILPLANQLLIRARTGVYVTGREVRGRINIPAIAELSSANGVPTGELLTAAQDAVDDHLLGAGGLNGSWVVYSPTKNRAEMVTEASVASFFAILRSRRD